ncbi:hypothetical protein BDP81DRAFT_388353 [Colletotrichum phormii]|uniref:Uncharacterized protein n=1 Tax=Colletotrichum phormii TaxID=359342 RepID=A0AAJ0A6E6_9PEZI|nr:uncharacterized protein BDP81DRAFT_388353 [Colletotrichum phormii]KAK1655420.1 hypothetical protein BDP81DRAFT_388353 [Colletotrichum phormii]
MTRNLAKPTITSPGFLSLHSYTQITYTINNLIYLTPNPIYSNTHKSSQTSTTHFITMAAFTLLFTPTTAVYGRSGYNKDGDDEEKNDRGRSGYNKDGDDDDEGQNKGRSGYNKDGDDEEDK